MGARSLALPFALALLGPFPVAAEPASGEQAMGRQLQEELRAHGGDVHGCYAIALAAHPGLAGELLVRIHVAQGGNVERAEVLKDQVNSPRLVACLTDAMAHWKVPRLAGAGTQQIVFPLVFMPDEAPAAHRIVVPLSDGKPGLLAGGKIDARVLIDAPRVGPTFASLTRLTLTQSTRLALHKHPGAIEILYVVKGRAHLRDAFGDPPEAAEAGDVVVLRAGAGHSVEAAPLAPLELIQIFVPGGPEAAYSDPRRREGTVATRRQPRPPGAQAGQEIIKSSSRKPVAVWSGMATVTPYLDPSTPEVALQRFEAEAGAREPTHSHKSSDEILFILSGRGELVVAGQTFPVAAFDAIHIPRGAPHALTVTDKLVAVQLFAPAGPPLAR